MQGLLRFHKQVFVTHIVGVLQAGQAMAHRTHERQISSRGVDRAVGIEKSPACIRREHRPANGQVDGRIADMHVAPVDDPCQLARLSHDMSRIKIAMHETVGACLWLRLFDDIDLSTQFVTVFNEAVDNGNFWAEYYAFAQHYNKQEAFRTAVFEATDPASADANRAFAALRVVGALWRTEDSGTYVEAARQLVGVSALPEVIADKGRSVVWSAQILESLVEEAVMPAEEQALARYYLSRVFVAAQKHMEAMVLITKAHADLPAQEAAEASIYIAVHYASREQYEPALSLLEEAFNAGVSDVGSRILYAQILAKTNRISEALAQYEGILKSEDLAEGDRLRVQQEFEALRGRAQGVMR